MTRSFYAVLGISSCATAAEIKTKYRELARKYHPDLVKDKVFGLRLFKLVNEAYRTLNDPVVRQSSATAVHTVAGGITTAKPGLDAIRRLLHNRRFGRPARQTIR